MYMDCKLIQNKSAQVWPTRPFMHPHSFTRDSKMKSAYWRICLNIWRCPSNNPLILTLDYVSLISSEPAPGLHPLLSLLSPHVLTCAYSAHPARLLINPHTSSTLHLLMSSTGLFVAESSPSMKRPPKEPDEATADEDDVSVLHWIQSYGVF